MKNQEIQQDLTGKGLTPGGPFLIQLLFKEKVSMPDKEKMVAVMEKQQTTHSDKLRELSDRVDNVENRLTTNSAYLNKLKGGIGLAMTLMTLIQGSVLAGAGWLLSTVIEAQEQLTSVQKSMHYIEMEQSRIIQAFLAATKEQK